MLATAIMSVWLWSIAVTGVLTAGTCPMSSIVVRSCWELQRGPWWPAQDKATSKLWVIWATRVRCKQRGLEEVEMGKD